MQYQNFPGTKQEISVIGLGTWVFGGEHWGGGNPADSRGVVEAAMEAGINFIDTAPFYSDGIAEQIVGEAIKGRRDKFFIATKCGIIRENGRIRHDLSVASVLKEVDASLTRLQCDVIDLYQSHWPDPEVLIERTMEALFKLQGSGKIRHIGMCNADIPLLERARRVAPVRTLQMQYSLLHQEIEKEILPYCLEHNIGLIAYGVLGGGILTGKYRTCPQFGRQDARKRFYRFFEGDAFDSAERMVRRLEFFGHPPSQSALNWVRGKKGVLTVLAGARTQSQLKENAGAAGWSFSEREYALCEQSSAEGV